MPTRGISLLDLLGAVPGAGLIPSDIAGQLEALAIVDHRATTSAGAYVHYGTIRSLADSGLPALRNWPVEVPGLNEGLPFQLTFTRAAATTGSSLEGEPTEWRLDLFLAQVSVIVPDLRPAKLAGGSGTDATHLVPDGSRSRVRIYGSGVFRIESTTTSNGVVVRFVDAPDTFDPGAPTGAVLQLGFDPPHFFLGDSQYGLTVDRLTYDDSDVYTPPEIEARGHDAAWRGLAIKDATFFAPPNLPIVGDVSAGVQDVLLGSPLGIQGQIRIEFGQTPVDPSLLTYLQLVDGNWRSMGAPSGTATDGFQVEFLPDTPAQAQVRAQLGSGAHADWILPGQSAPGVVDAGDSGPFTAEDGSILAFRTHETAQDGTDALAPAVGTSFTHAGGTVGHAPLIKVTLGGVEKPNCVSLTGPPDKLAGLQLTADPQTDPQLTWRLGDGADAGGADGASFTLPQLAAGDVRDLVLRDGHGHTRRVRITVTADGPFAAGCALGVYDEHGSALATHGVDGTFRLDAFHSGGALLPAETAATASGTSVTVPQGELARVTLTQSAAPSDPPAPAPDPPAADRWIQILMRFADTTEMSWGERSPADASVFSFDAVDRWAAGFSGASFVVVGRTCDLGTEALNRDLGTRRAAEGARLLGSRTVYQRGERTTFTDAAAIAAEAQAGWTAAATNGSWLIESEHPEYTGWDGGNRDLPPRPSYRRVDIYAAGGTAAPDAATTPNDAQQQSPGQLRALVPGVDPAAATPPARTEPTLPYRVLLVVEWDSPTVVGWGDAIPTLVELTIAWQPHAVALPGAPSSAGADGSVTLQHANPSAPAVWTVKAHLAHDARTGQTLMSLSIEEEGGGPDAGIAHIDNTIAAACLGLGPALVAGIGAVGIDGAAVRLAALIAAGAFISVFAKTGKVVLHKITLEDRQESFSSLENSRQRLLFDYTVEIGFDATEGPIHISTGDHPMKIRYRNVGVELDNSKQGLDRFGLVFDNVDFDIQDPGHWQIDGPLGELLRVAGSRSGSGSSWMELDLRFAIDLGVVTISGATIRLTFDAGNVSVELRGLQVGADIPGVLSGTGGLQLLSGGGVAANIDVQIEPINIEAMAQFVINMPEVALEMGVLFAVGIPLANSGLGLFGFIGRFVVNGARQLPAGSDPIQQEIDWYHATLADKYHPQQGAWALGLGAVVGTLPDTAYTFNAIGSIAISFPDPSVVFAIDAKFLGTPHLPAENGSGSAPTTALTILGIVAVDSSAVKVGIRGSYEIPEVLQLRVPINGYFPLPGNPAAPYLRIGADDVNGRTGPPVTLTILPSTLDVQAWAYTMIEAHELHALGGDTTLNFDGFSVGFGAGFELKYGSDDIGLDVSAKVLIGLGTKPMLLAGKIIVRGELKLVVVSISVDGEIDLIVDADTQYLHGHFCASIDCFFFSISGCVDVSFGDPPTLPMPVPDSPVLGVDLTDRRAVITGKAAREGSSDAVPVVWPDTVPVVHFAHRPRTALAGGAFSPGQADAGPDWSGSNELQYAFRLVGVDILDHTGTALAGPLDSAWWMPTFRPGVSTGTSPAPSSAEGRDLGLLSWNPAPWARNLIDGGVGAPGDPATTLGSVCDPAPVAERVCMYGQDAVPEGAGLVAIPAPAPTAPPFVSYCVLHGDGTNPPSGLQQLLLLASETGTQLVPGAVAALAAPMPAGPARAFRLPSLTSGGQTLMSLPWIGRFSTALVDPELLLAVCLTRPPAGSDGQRTCSELADVKPERGSRKLMWQGVLYEGSARLVAGGDGGRGLLLGTGLRITLPNPVDEVDLQLAGLHTGGDARGYAADGTVVATVAIAPEATSATLSGTGISQVALAPHRGAKGAALTGVCYSSAPAPDTFAPILTHVASAAAQSAAGYPVVEGARTEGGAWETWRPKLQATERSDGGACIYVAYEPPDSGPWWGFRVRALPRRPVFVVSCCGIAWTAAVAQQDDADYQGHLTDVVNAHANAGGDPLPAQHPILVPDSDYTIRVRCEWQGWQPAAPGANPPPVDDSAWQALPDELFHFHTAAETHPIPAEPPHDVRDESSFDPRATARYLIGFEPDGRGAPHFLDDPIRVDFSVDHLPQLLSLYARDLALKLRRTSQPAGALAGGAHPGDEPITVTWVAIADALLHASDRRIKTAMTDAPCLSPAPLGPTSAQVDADLLPDNDYDLLLVAPPAATPDSDAVLIARAHFHSSRYRNAGEMLGALGLADATPDPLLPYDAVLSSSTASLPATAGPTTDDALHQVLADLELDPWPLPDRPRVTLVWRPAATTGFELCGALLEGDEPLLRPVDLSAVSGAVGGLALHAVRANTAGTRVLLSATTPAAVAETDPLVITLTASGATWTRRKRHAGAPRIAYQETL